MPAKRYRWKALQMIEPTSSPTQILKPDDYSQISDDTMPDPARRLRKRKKKLIVRIDNRELRPDN
jgi:hypothetical protein